MQLQEKFPETVKAYSLNVDYDEEDGDPPQKLQDEILELLKTKEISVTNIVSNTNCDTVLDGYEIFSLPAVLVFGKDGSLHKLFENEFSYDDVINEVESLTKAG